MPKFDVILLTMILALGNVGYLVNGQTCYPTQAQFISDCTNVYKGVVNGGRCFFIGGAPAYSRTTWANAWTQCKNQGGTLAHIHTSNEMTAITNYCKAFYNNTSQQILFAMSRDPTLTNTSNGRAIDLQKTRWYTDCSNYNPLLIAGNTWARTHQADDLFAKDFDCYSLFGNFTRFGDVNCSVTYSSLCTVYNAMQTFTLISTTASGNCMAEVVIQSYSNATTPDDCATHCAGFIWCRGFNYYSTGQKCDLFSWYYKDTTIFVTKSDCYHFAYNP